MPKDFDIDRDSTHLKQFVAKYHPDSFIADIATLLTYIDTPRMGIYPFQGLDSPLRQLTYVASLNLSSDPALATENREISNEEWLEIVSSLINIKAGYYDLLLPKTGEDKDEYAKLYKIAMPVFMNYFDTGALNYEEQSIERIERFFTPFDNEVFAALGLTVSDFINIYNLLDDELLRRFNFPLELMKKDSECDNFFKEQMKAKIHPFEWQYNGENENIIALAEFMKNRGARFTVNIQNLRQNYTPDKVACFFELFTLNRTTTDYLFYTAKNPVLHKPIIRTQDNEYLIINIQQLISSIYLLLNEFLTSAKKSVQDRFFENRGKVLQDKTAEIISTVNVLFILIMQQYLTAMNRIC